MDQVTTTLTPAANRRRWAYGKIADISVETGHRKYSKR